jgi:membrane protease YdiL (CAAX protease family)
MKMLPSKSSSLGSIFIFLALLGLVWPVSPPLQLAVAASSSTYVQKVLGYFFTSLYVFALVSVGTSLKSGRPWPRLFGASAIRDATVGLCFGVATVSGLLIGATTDAQSPNSFHWIYIALLSLGFALVTALSEELLLRGVLQEWLSKRLRLGVVVLVQGVLFSALHPNQLDSFIALIFFFVTGCTLSLAAFAYNTLWTAILWHFVWNFTQKLANGAAVGSEFLSGLAPSGPASVASFLPLVVLLMSAAYLANSDAIQRRINNSSVGS